MMNTRVLDGLQRARALEDTLYMNRFVESSPKVSVLSFLSSHILLLVLTS